MEVENKAFDFDVSIIIVNYNTRELLIQCVNSIIKETEEIKYEIIVVDNCSKDGSVDMLKRDFPLVVIIENEENFGFGKANNIGVKYARGEFLFFLNSDTILLNNSVLIFYRFFLLDCQNKIGVLGANLIDINEYPVHSFGKFPSMRCLLKEYMTSYGMRLFKRFANEEKKITATNNCNVIEVDYVTGAAMFMKREVFTQFGMFDPMFFMYYEETDLQKKMADKGLSRLVINGPKIAHYEGGSDSSSYFSYRKRVIHTESMLYYHKKRTPKCKYRVFVLLLFVIRIPLLFDKRVSMTSRIKYLIYLAGKVFS